MWQTFAFLDYSQRSYYYQFCLDSWLCLALSTFVCIMAVLFVFLSLNNAGEASPLTTGFAMLSIVTFSATLSELVTALDNLAFSTVAVSRIKSFKEQSPQEAQSGELHPSIPDCWPSSGKTELRSVCAAYR
jgi:ABC-type siderophore export system fused ATPase/permease subunit